MTLDVAHGAKASVIGAQARGDGCSKCLCVSTIVMTLKFMRQLQPCVNNRTDELEPLRIYCRRVRPLIPNFPTSVIVQWLYRHYSCVEFQYCWLDFNCLRFTKQLWSTETIMSSVRAYEEEIVENSRHVMFAYPDHSRLERHMMRWGTWPRPIIVLDKKGIPPPRGPGLMEPFHLLEGHRRSGYLRALHDREMANPFHQVWFVTWKSPV